MKADPLTPKPPASPKDSFIRWFADIGIEDVPSVGGKNASLGEMVRELSSEGVKVPNGFATTAEAYRHFLREAELDQKLADLLREVNSRNLDDLRKRAKQARQAILSADFPAGLVEAIRGAYRKLDGNGGQPADVAVRSSATAEDLPTASFAGQQESYLNIQGEDQLLVACKRCFASLFTDRAISYRIDKGFDHLRIALSIGIQKMVRSDLAASGIMFSIDTESGFPNAVLINASYGLGENIVQGAINPDEYYVFKPTLRDGFRPILQKTMGSKEFKLVYDLGGSKFVKNVPVPPEERRRYAISDEEILQLARWACVIEEHYSKKRGMPTPMDMEWAKDGLTGELFILQARPETVQSQKNRNVLEIYRLQEQSKPLARGRSVGEKVASGVARVIPSVQLLHEFRDGEILVTEKTDPDWEPVMKRAGAIVTNRGGRTCHAAIVSRELGVPAVVGTGNATEVVRSGQPVTVSCAEGEVGTVYEGKLPFAVERIDLQELPRPKTKILMNVGNPEQAFSLSFIPNDGVGLARMEFILTTYIRVHPMALIRFDQLEDAGTKTEIERLTAGYQDKREFFIEKLAQGISMISAAFYPKDVIFRLSDFKTNEYANLIGGKQFEPVERNPMVGFRGASRYYNPRYREGFALECAAAKRVREGMGLTNLKLMVPVVRTVEEGRRVLSEMEKNGLVRGVGGLEVYMMCEIPSNVILAEEFAEIFDGFSIGSNDLTQLVLGVDRDSEIVAPIFDERNAAVKRMIAQVIHTAKAKGRKIGICGQAPSDYPEFAEFLVEEGIDSISLNPDTVIKTTLLILKKEKELPLGRG
ncbi:phosphoenolpyruvate synthase [Verrucomicrobium sp. 3C]|uniref:phosphoenolpyruvate synthase n=1 Tax=Verrucomicrobium sp. 3C TaxID=1134055 RepID=UPI00036A717B|nr:phosphoenolpyruvate synthase [Verrucomicrobium sp. 3C]